MRAMYMPVVSVSEDGDITIAWGEAFIWNLDAKGDLSHDAEPATPLLSTLVDNTSTLDGLQAIVDHLKGRNKVNGTLEAMQFCNECEDVLAGGKHVGVGDFDGSDYADHEPEVRHGLRCPACNTVNPELTYEESILNVRSVEIESDKQCLAIDGGKNYDGDGCPGLACACGAIVSLPDEWQMDFV